MIDLANNEGFPLTLGDLIPESAIELNLEGMEKPQVIERLLVRLDRAGVLADGRRALDDLLNRERHGSTALGRGVALPHAKTLGAQRPALAVGRFPMGVDFESLDGKPVYLVFLFIAPLTRAGLHLKVLATLTRFLRDGANRRRLLELSEDEAVRALLGGVQLS